MHARLQITTRIHTGPDAAAGLDWLMNTISGHPGFRGAYAMQAVGTVSGQLLTLWDSAEEAADASNRTRAAAGDRMPGVEHVYDRVLEVADAWTGQAGGETPAAGVAIFFDGPVSDAQVAAGMRAHHERILPAVLSVPGIVRGWVLVDPERRSVVVVSLATSVEALEASSAALAAAPLLPGEDPALLVAPDRVVACRVSAARASAPATV
jgi:hypothetical protein